MRVRLVSALLAALLASTSPSPARAGEPVPPPNANWAGTTDIQWGDLPGGPKIAKRVGVLAYCADLAAGASATGLQADKRSIRNGPWLIDGPFSNMGQYGAQNVADYVMYDDGIDRARDVVVVDGDRELPTATQLIQNFDIVIAYTDNKCGQPIPTTIANSAAAALQGFIAVPGKGLILTGFAFSSSIGFGNAIFGGGLSPLRKGGPGLDARCSRGQPCGVGTCPATNPDTGFTCAIAGAPPECLDEAGNVCTQYQPWPATADFACDHMLSSVRGPTSSSWATRIASPASVAPGATLCFNYDVAGTAMPYLAINASRNIIAFNTFPADATDIQKFWYACILGNAVQYLSGDKTRCTTRGCR